MRETLNSWSRYLAGDSGIIDPEYFGDCAQDIDKTIDYIAKLEGALSKAFEAMQWNLGGEPLDTLMVGAIDEIKALGIKAKESGNNGN